MPVASSLADGSFAEIKRPNSPWVCHRVVSLFGVCGSDTGFSGRRQCFVCLNLWQAVAASGHFIPGQEFVAGRVGAEIRCRI